MKIISKTFILIICLWQATLSPDKGFLRFLYFSPIFSLSNCGRAGCKFHPSCSEYAINAFKDHSPVKALILSTKRVFSCHPLSKKKYNG